jgi:threonine/homoserine/homoserine lactone efflux protein
MASDWGYLFQGAVVGFSIAAPVGQIGVLCIQRSLLHGRAHGFASGLGAATADALYGAVAGFGLAFLSAFLVSQQFWFRLVGGVFLVNLAVRTILRPPAAQAASATGRGLMGSYLSTLFLTLTNPMTILSYGAIMAGLGVGASTGALAGAAIWVLGVFLGSAAWWLLLSTGVGALRGRVTPRLLRWVNLLAGLVIGAFGLWALAGLLR